MQTHPANRAALPIHLAILFVVAAGFLTGTGHCQAQVHERKTKVRIGHGRCCGRQDVILIRGGAGYWPGAKDLARHLQHLGYVPTIIQHWEYRKVAAEIEQAVREGRMGGGVMIVGYSTGADAACHLAEQLDKRGISVNTMILVESTLGRAVPRNVEYCVNYFESRPFDAIPILRGIPVAARSPETALTNIDVGREPNMEFLAARHHLTLGNSHRLHQMVGALSLTRQPPVLAR